jgi:hypothetical protein
VKEDVMDKKESCIRILLAKNAAGRVGFCETCDAVELEIGPMSLRIVADDLHYLAQLIKEADIRLSYYRLEKARYKQQQPVDLSFH